MDDIYNIYIYNIYIYILYIYIYRRVISTKHHRESYIQSLEQIFNLLCIFIIVNFFDAADFTLYL